MSQSSQCDEVIWSSSGLPHQAEGFSAASRTATTRAFRSNLAQGRFGNRLPTLHPPRCKVRSNAPLGGLRRQRGRRVFVGSCGAHAAPIPSAINSLTLRQRQVVIHCIRTPSSIRTSAPPQPKPPSWATCITRRRVLDMPPEVVIDHMGLLVKGLR